MTYACDTLPAAIVAVGMQVWLRITANHAHAVQICLRKKSRNVIH